MRFLTCVTVCLVLVGSACEQKECCVLPDPETNCYGFDIRSCLTDEFAVAIGFDYTDSAMLDSISTYLDRHQVRLVNAKLERNFHESVCEACHICPNGDRVFVQIHREDTQRFEALDLLGREEENCNEHF